MHVERKWHVRADGSMGECTAKDEASCPYSSEEGTRHYTDLKEARTYAEEQAKVTKEEVRTSLKKTKPSVQQDVTDNGTGLKGRADRITSLIRTDLDPDGLMNHSQPMVWNPKGTTTEKGTLLSYRYGNQWINAHENDLDGQREKVKEVVLAHYGGTKMDWPTKDPHRLDDAPARVEVTLLGEGKDRLPDHNEEWIAQKTGRTPYAVVDRYDEHGNLIGPRVYLTTGTKYTLRSMLANAACNVYTFNMSTTPMLGLRSSSWRMARNTLTGLNGRKINQVDAASLIGFESLRQDVRDNTGIDFVHLDMDRDERKNMLRRVSARFDELASEEEWAQSQAQYEHNARHGKIATAFTDKVHTSKKAEEAAKNTRLHENFSHIEFDEDMDLDKLPQLEGEINVAMKNLPKTRIPISTLRVRKLGKYRANTMGVYSPFYNAIVLDDGKATRNGYSGMSSFIHEYAHHVDHTMEDGQMMSMSKDFRPVLEAVNKELDGQDEITASFKGYLKTPTEVFSRCFEWWAVKKLGVKSSLTKTEEEYDNGDKYKAISKHGELVDQVMSKLFPGMAGFDTLDKKNWGE